VLIAVDGPSTIDAIALLSFHGTVRKMARFGFTRIPQLRSAGSARRNSSVAKSQPKADPPVAEMPSASKQTSISGAWMER
jgi:hypothetical protein